MVTKPLRPRLSTRTTRLSIRPLAPADFDLWRTANDEHPPPDSPFDPGPKPSAELTRASFRTMLRRNQRLQQSDIAYHFGLFDRAEKNLFGFVSLQVVARMFIQQAWIGWRVFGQHRRKGYAREGVESVIKTAFRELSLHRLEAGVEPANRVSIRLARSLGMRKEASLKKAIFLRDVWRDLDVYATVAEDWDVQMVPAIGLVFGDPRRVETR